MISPAVAAILERLQNDEDVWSDAVSAGIQARESKDEQKFTLGDIAAVLPRKYGEDVLSRYAAEIDEPVERVREYSGVCSFFPPDVRTEFDDTLITYTHYRHAKRLKNREAALAFLRDCQANDWNSARAGVEISMQLGKPTPPRKLVDELVCILEVAAYDNQPGMVVFQVEPATASIFMQLWRKNAPVRLTLYEVND